MNSSPQTHSSFVSQPALAFERLRQSFTAGFSVTRLLCVYFTSGILAALELSDYTFFLLADTPNVSAMTFTL